MQPVTTGGKKRRSRPIRGAANSVNKPAPITAPHTPAKPTFGFEPMAITGPTLLNATPCRIGKRTPNFQNPMVCSSVEIPEQKSAVLIRIVVSADDILSRRDDERHRNRADISNQHVLKSERNHLALRQALIDRVGGGVHRMSPEYSLLI